MSASVFDPKANAARASRPGRRWKNVYWSVRELNVRGGPLGPGRIFGAEVWPSKDMAETAALEWLAEFGDQGVTYLGAETID